MPGTGFVETGPMAQNHVPPAPFPASVGRDPIPLVTDAGDRHHVLLYFRVPKTRQPVPVSYPVMCILFLAIDSHPDYPLIVAANRDEYHRRATAAMSFWSDHPQVLAGRDLQMGGTWLGITRNGRFCAITNLRSAAGRDDTLSSRGELAKRFLTSAQGPEHFGRHLAGACGRYNPFNIVFGTPGRLFTFSSQDRVPSRLSAGFHSISNGRMDETWPKMSHGVRQLTVLVQGQSAIRTAHLNRIMQNPDPHESMEAAQGPSADPPDPFVSSIFIRGEHFGTRSTSCILFRNDAIRVSEQRYDRKGTVTGTSEFTIRGRHA